MGFSKRRSESSATRVLLVGVVVGVAAGDGFAREENVPLLAGAAVEADDDEDDRARDGYFARMELRNVVCFAEARDILL